MLEREKSALEVSLQQTVSEAEVMKGTLTTELEATQSRLQQTKVCIKREGVFRGGGRDIACTLVSCHVPAVFCGATLYRAAEPT